LRWLVELDLVVGSNVADTVPAVLESAVMKSEDERVGAIADISPIVALRDQMGFFRSKVFKRVRGECRWAFGSVRDTSRQSDRVSAASGTLE